MTKEKRMYLQVSIGGILDVKRTVPLGYTKEEWQKLSWLRHSEIVSKVKQKTIKTRVVSRLREKESKQEGATT